VESASDLPVGWTDVQDAGSYRLERREDDAYFGYVVGPHSWKRYLYPPRSLLWRGTRAGRGFEVEQPAPEERYAFLGVRACELAAMRVQDRVFLDGPVVDPGYQALRNRAFVVAVQCVQAGGTCFCVSMNTGPAVTGGADLTLTEVVADGQHYFTIAADSPEGAAVLAELPGEDATDEHVQAAVAAVDAAAAHMGRALDTHGIRALLHSQQNNTMWDEVADRCLTCGNCTMVCPTCFCHTVEDTMDLSATTAERWRQWDSCFTGEFSYVHGGALRRTTRARYRHWITHKLASWHDQFDMSGCVGCGRCITWCPVGIDITQEIAALRERTGAVASTRSNP
jgi:formate hydrogenlyase subunit 6/NADH:ubiquinone oxidoreductase subunit I